MTGKVVLITVTTCIIFIREARTTANSAGEVPIRNFFPKAAASIQGNVADEWVILFSHCEINFAGVRNVEVGLRHGFSTDLNPNAIPNEEIYVGGISATKPCRNLLGRQKTLLKPTEWCTVCEKYNTTNLGDLHIFMKINQMHSIIHKLPKSIPVATSRFHCAYKCEKVRQLYSLCRMQVLVAPN